MQVQLSAALKANTQDAGAAVRKNGLFECWPPEKMETFVPKLILASQCGQRFSQGGRGKAEQRDQV